MGKCKHCKIREGIFPWNKLKFCQPCTHKLYTIWESRWILKREPELLQYAVPNPGMDEIENKLWIMDKEDKVYDAAAKKLDEYGIKS